MSARARILLVVGAAALVAAALAVLAARQGLPDGHGAKRPKGPPELVLDLGVRTDPEAQALRKAAALYARGDLDGARTVAERFQSPQAQVMAAFAAWPAGTLAHLEALEATYPRSSFVELHLGLALVWSGQDANAIGAFKRATKLQPDTQSAVTAGDFLHPRMAPGLPFFVPSFSAPRRISALPAPEQFAAYARAARRADWRAKLLYGVALARLGHPLSAEAQFAAAARLAPDEPEALTAAAVGRFTKDDPSAAFSRLGPLAKRFPHAATVRFHLGLLLLWIAQVQQAKVELRRAVADDPRSILAREAQRFIDRLK